MRLEIKEFRIPIALTVLMLGVIMYWAWQTWHRLDDHNIGRAQHEAIKTSDILVTALCTLDQGRQLGRNEIEQRFGTILDASSYQFFILIQDDQRIFQVGKVPAGLPSTDEESAFFIDDTFISSRMVRLHKNMTGEKDQGNSGLGITDGDYLLMIGRDTREDHMPTPKFIEHIIVPFVAALLILVANAAAWLMVIRNRSLFEQLEIERARSAYSFGIPYR